jgi:pteridine reductase
MPLRTPHKRALVAGGTGRVGTAIVERLRADGWTVVSAGSSDGDLRTRAGAASLATNALDRLGGLELVVHAAGAGFAPKPIDEVTEEDWDAAMGVTAKGTFFLAQAVAPALRESNGVLVILEDVASFQAWPSFAAHCAAKAA